MLNYVTLNFNFPLHTSASRGHPQKKYVHPQKGGWLATTKNDAKCGPHIHIIWQYSQRNILLAKWL